MKKQDVKHILMSMRTAKNEADINRILGKLDMINEEDFQKIVREAGNTEEKIRQYLEKQLTKRQEQSDEKYPINQMFTYGIAGNCVHLHLPGDLHEMIARKGFSKTIDTVNIWLLDAIDKIRTLKDTGFYRFQEQDSIYMISPILLKRELNFLNSMDFETHTYSKKDLQDDKFVEEHPEAQLATKIFGNDKNIGTASIQMQIVATKEWQQKKKTKIEELKQKGVTVEQNSQSNTIE